MSSGAVAVTSYAESYLRARIIPNAKQAAAMIREVAAASAAHSSDPGRRAVGEARAELGALEKALTCTNQIVGDTLNAVQQAGSGL